MAFGGFLISPLEYNTKLALTYIELSSSTLSTDAVVDLISACQRLVSFHYQPTISESTEIELDGALISEALSLHKASLEYLFLDDFSDHDFEESSGPVGILADFKMLQKLIISGGLFLGIELETPLVDALPENLSCLEIIDSGCRAEEANIIWKEYAENLQVVKEVKFPMLKKISINDISLQQWLGLESSKT